MSPGSQTVLKRRMASRMRALREGSGVSRDEAAGVIHSSVQTIGHIETGRSLPSGLQIEKLLAHYGVPDLVDTYLELRHLARTSRDWWTALAGEVPAHRALLYGAESTAARIETWDPFRVPELGRTPDYARALASRAPAAEVDPGVELLLARQRAVLDSPDVPTLELLVGEAALCRPVGGGATMRAQVEHLLELADRPRVELRVVPLDAGAHGGSFTVLTFAGPGEESAAAYAETLVHGYYYDGEEQVAVCRAAVDDLRRAALDAAEVPAFLRRVSR